ncbi:MAG: hypothetical protein ACLFQX_10385, partial [Candidatus Kapaibacterium sp.]
AISWQYLADSSARVRILINAGDKEILRFADNTGYYSIPAEDMAALPAGAATVSITIGNYELMQLPDGYYAIAAVGSARSVAANLTQ